MTKIFALVFGLTISSAAVAQDYGLTIGIHQTTASVASKTGSNALADGTVNGRLNYDLGLTASFELVPSFRFRTGVLYDTRGFDYKFTNGDKLGVNFAYIDIPVNVQYNFTPMFGLYGGLIVGVKASDSVNVPGSGTYNPNMKSMYPLINVGANFLFNDMIGFDVYYENGLGEFADSMKNYSTVGLHFIYWL